MFKEYIFILLIVALAKKNCIAASENLSFVLPLYYLRIYPYQTYNTRAVKKTTSVKWWNFKTKQN